MLCCIAVPPPVTSPIVAASHSFGPSSFIGIAVTVSLPPAGRSLTGSHSHSEYLPCHAYLFSPRFSAVLPPNCYWNAAGLEWRNFRCSILQKSCSGPISSGRCREPPSLRCLLILSCLLEYRQKTFNNCVVCYFLVGEGAVYYAFVKMFDEFSHPFV